MSCYIIGVSRSNPDTELIFIAVLSLTLDENNSNELLDSSLIL